jgi:hypothetical protein
MPVGCSIFPKDLLRVSRRWAEKRYPNLIYWNRLDRGGHFAAFEQPDLFVKELRACFGKMRAMKSRLPMEPVSSKVICEYGLVAQK